MTKEIDFSLPDGWELVCPAIYVPVVGIIAGWVATYKRGEGQFLTILYGEHSGLAISWSYLDESCTPTPV